jgi:hypothetical protein
MATKKVKDYVVNVDMKYSMEYRVKAKTAGEARKKIWRKFINRPPSRCFDIMVDKA